MSWRWDDSQEVSSIWRGVGVRAGIVALLQTGSGQDLQRIQHLETQPLAAQQQPFVKGRIGHVKSGQQIAVDQFDREVKLARHVGHTTGDAWAWTATRWRHA
ncbi:MAG: hypothetical protein R2854_31490 [Caldilineaceae bacterium]